MTIINKKYIEKNFKGRYTINIDGSYDIDGDVYICDQNITEIKIKFNHVSGSFDCHNNHLKSLKGCPQTVDGFYCSNNQLKSLEGISKNIKRVYCGNNQLPFDKLNNDQLIDYLIDINMINKEEYLLLKL